MIKYLDLNSIFTFKHHGKTLIITIDSYGTVQDYKDAVNSKIAQNINSNLQTNGQVCHECQKLDLRSKVETSQAYNQFVK
jgi:hypothetical protein